MPKPPPEKVIQWPVSDAAAAAERLQTDTRRDGKRRKSKEEGVELQPNEEAVDRRTMIGKCLPCNALHIVVAAVRLFRGGGGHFGDGLFCLSA